MYTFVKGQGWVPGYDTAKQHAIEGRDGVFYYLLERTPVAGEKWLARSSLQQAIDSMKNYTYADFSEATQEDIDYYTRVECEWKLFVIEQ